MKIESLTKDIAGNYHLYGTYFHIEGFDLSELKNTEMDPDVFTDSNVGCEDNGDINLSTEIIHEDKHYYSIDHYPYTDDGLNKAKNEIKNLMRTMIFEVILDGKMKFVDYKTISREKFLGEKNRR